VTDLYGELKAAAFAVRQVHIDRLRFLGVPLSWMAATYTFPFGVAPCEPSGGFYQPLDGEGALHLILPVLDEGALVDLVAFRTTAPDAWLLRTGNGYALGLEEGLNPWMWYAPADLSAKPPKHQVGKPAYLARNPLDWMQAAGEGLCVLDWSAPEVRQLDALPCVTAADHDTAKLLRSALTRPPRLPSIRVAEGVAHAAAA
jgi:hypothetical protein